MTIERSSDPVEQAWLHFEPSQSAIGNQDFFIEAWNAALASRPAVPAATGKLIAEAKLHKSHHTETHHPEINGGCCVVGQWRDNFCNYCDQTWPCLGVRAADALEVLLAQTAGGQQ